MSKLRMEEFGKDTFKITLPSRSDATLELFQAIYDTTEVDISLEDDGYIIVYTEDQSEAEKIKQTAEDFLSKSESGYGDVKGLEPGDKDIKRIEDLRDKADGDEIKMHKLAQNMANTFKNANSYEKCIRRAKAAEVLELGGVAKIFYKKAEEIKPDEAAAGMWSSPFSSKENALKLKELMSKPWLVVKNEKGDYLELPDAYEIIGDDSLFDDIFDLKAGEDARPLVKSYLKKWLDRIDSFRQVDADAVKIVEKIIGTSTASVDYEWENMGSSTNKQTSIEVGDEEVIIDVIKESIQEIGVTCPGFTLSHPLDSVSYDRALIAADKFINGLTPEMIQSKEKTNEFLLGCLGQSTASDDKKIGKVVYRKEGMSDSASYFVKDGSAFFHLKDQELGKEFKGKVVKFRINENDEATDLEATTSEAGKVKELITELTEKYLKETKNMDMSGAERLAVRYEKEHKLSGLADELFANYQESMDSFHSEGDVAKAEDFLENKYSNEEEEFTIQEFEKDAGSIPELKKFKNAFYSIVHYNKETDQFEIMVYPKEADYNKNNPKVLVLESDLTTVATSSSDEDAKSKNVGWGFRGSLNGAPFSLSDDDASNAFTLTVHYISNKTGYTENVIRDFLDSQAGSYLGDMVSNKSMEGGNLDSVSKAIKETIGEGALDKLRFEKFIESHNPSADVSTASESSNYDIFIDELEKCKGQDRLEVAPEFLKKWHSLDKIADFFAEVYNGGLNQYLDHYGDAIPRSALADVGGLACKEILAILRDGSDAIKDYVEFMAQSNDSTPDEDYEDALEPLNEMTNKIYENDKIEKACEEILKFYGVK